MGPPGRPLRIPGPNGRVDPWQQRFQSLQPYRVLDILLISSAYDAFVLEEDGSLTDRLYSHYLELSLSATPRISHASSAASALRMLRARHFDLVIMVVRPGGAEADELSRSIKSYTPGLPVVLLVFDESDLEAFPDQRVPPTIDRVFLWGGSTDVLLGAIKSVEDTRNATHDTEVAGVGVMIVVEDGIRGYSSFVSLLYPLLFQQTQSLIAEGLNDHHRLLRMRARPKILLATTVAEAEALYHRYADYLTALLTDMRMPNLAGQQHPRAGLELAKRWRRERWDLPVLFQSAETELASEAERMGGWFVDKNAADFRSRVRRFFVEALGFGDFVFRLPDRTEVGRARDVYELERLLPSIPEASIRYHAESNHFSLWLTARSLFHLARRIRPMRLEDFGDADSLRTDFVRMLREARFYEQEGVITDLGSRNRGTDSRFIRLGRGSIGGKGRSVAFVSSLIVRHGLLTRHPGLQIRIPKTLVLGTDAFDRFMDELDVPALIDLEDDAELNRRIQEASLPDDVLQDLRLAFANLEGPLAVRSSTLLEDSRFRPFAGVYHTEMLANDGHHQERFEALCRAIKTVYASTYAVRAKRYLAGTPHDAEEQKMAVCIQQVVGRDYGHGRYYPVLSGVAQSCNLYPVGGQLAEDGVAHLALGLGHTVVSGGIALRFSPGHPSSLPQYPDAVSFVRGCQRHFYAIAVGNSDALGRVAGVHRYELKDAEEDGTLRHVASVYNAQDDVLRDNVRLSGPRVVTFNNILKWRSIPLAEALVALLRLLREGLGEEVELEFAVDLPDQGDEEARLYVLQVRPQGSLRFADLEVHPDDVPTDSRLATTDLALGHGSSPPLFDVVHVVADPLLPQTQHALCAEVAAVDRELREAKRPYLLIGPGRWGSSDGTLGLSVSWSDISGARVIVETPIGKRRVEPSQGTHFFRNITAARVAYLTIADTEDSWLRRPWLEAAWRAQGGEEAAMVRHVRLDEPVRALLDGRRSLGVITTS